MNYSSAPPQSSDPIQYSSSGTACLLPEKEVTALGEADSAHAIRNDQGKMLTWIPGVYETVDTPDPVMAIEPRYFLGTQAKRDFFTAYKGQQTYTGSLGGFVLLDGKALRFPIGKVTTLPMEADDTTAAIGAAAITIASHLIFVSW